MFRFFKEFDKDIYKEIVDEVEFNMWNDRCISIIQSEIEKIIKIILKESNIIITNIGNDGVIYREYCPSLSRIFNEKEFKQYLDCNNILTYSDIDEYWKILNVRNDKEHGEKANKEKIKITSQMKKDSLKYLFKLCYNSYVYKFKKVPKTYWDDEYFKKLLNKPQEKFIKVEKVIEKEIKIIDNTELKKIKDEHEKLKKQFEIIKNTTIPSSSNIELLKKLEVANKCIEKKDFENAKLAFNNCRILDVSCFDAYIGLILCEFKIQGLEELKINLEAPINLNEYYKYIIEFCSDEEKNKIIELGKDINYANGKRLYKIGDYYHAYLFFKESFNNRLTSRYINSIIKYFKDQLSEFLLRRDFSNLKNTVDLIETYFNNEDFDKDFKFILDKCKKEIKNCLFIEFIRFDTHDYYSNIDYFDVEYKIDDNSYKTRITSNAALHLFNFPSEYKNMKFVYIKDIFKTVCGYMLHDNQNIHTISKEDEHYIIQTSLNKAVSMFIKTLKSLLTIEGIRLPEGVTEIDIKNSINRDVKFLYLPDTLEKLPWFRIENFEKIEYVKLPQSPKIDCIPFSTFADFKNLKYIKIPPNIKYINRNAFCDCKCLRYVEFSKGLVEIASSAFCGCTSLKEIVLPKSLEEIVRLGFSRYKKLKITFINNKK